MLRCASCTGILTKSETVCFSCGESITQAQHKQARNRFSLAVNIAFYASIAVVVMSFFSEGKLPLPICLAVTVVLLFAKRSAENLSGKSQG